MRYLLMTKGKKNHNFTVEKLADSTLTKVIKLISLVMGPTDSTCLPTGFAVQNIHYVPVCSPETYT